MDKLNERYGEQIELMENIIYDTTFGGGERSGYRI